LAFLIEYGFHTNHQDASIYVNKRQELAEITASRIAEHYGLKKTSAPDKPASKPTQSSPTYYDYPPATYEVLRAINTYDKPSGNVKGKLAKGAKIKAIKEVRSGVPGVWLQLDGGQYIQAQEWRTINVKKIAVAKPVQGIDGRTSGTWQVTARIGVNVRTKPSTDADADIVAAYQKGQKVNIHSTVTAGGYIWGQYIGATSGQKRLCSARNNKRN